MEYTLSIGGEEVDSSKDSGPLEFLQGSHNIITGLESQLYGMRIGDTRQIIISPEDGYGEVDPQAMIDMPLEVGIELEIRDEDGELFPATIVEVSPATVKLDFNHPLAGETLQFDVEIVDLRAPTPEELDHGHVHGGHSHNEHFDEEFSEYFEEEDEGEEEK
jgi:FKBP-type peptidyl-prolyl cis-trans isomerase SlyD